MRLHLTLALITVLALGITLHSARKHLFTFAQVEAMAQQTASEKFVQQPNVLPPQLKSLTPQQEYGIFWNDSYRLWRSKGLPFQVDFYHVSKAFPFAPPINTIDRKGPHPLAYRPSLFRFSGLTFNPPLPSDLGFAGFYLRYPLNKPNSLDGFFSVQGASYYRVIATDQVYGLTSRGLAINTGVDGKPEEFPAFTQWWLRQPAADDTQMTLYALLDSPSVSGAYEFRVRPGGVTSVTVHASLFFRKAVDELGIAPFSSMYLFGENAKNHFGENSHPEIHDSDGVLMEKNNRDWVWRPLQQRPDKQIYAFPDENPRGFGLLQRDRDFQHYQDLDAKYNVRPSAWVTPQGNWGKGTYQLVQLPTNNTNTDNVILFWRPDQKPKAGDHIDISYTIDFYMNDAGRPPLAYCKQTLVADPAPPLPPVVPAEKVPTPPPVASGKTAAVAIPPAPPPPAPPTGTTPVQFMVDFAGNGVENIPANQPPHLELSCIPPATYLRDSRVEKNGYDNSWRVTFTIIPVKHFVPTELLCHLSQNGRPLTETWSYTWHQ